MPPKDKGPPAWLVSHQFLRKSCHLLMYYLDRMTLEERQHFYRVCRTGSERSYEFQHCDQKGNTWFMAREDASTGSVSAAEVGHGYKKETPASIIKMCNAPPGTSKDEIEPDEDEENVYGNEDEDTQIERIKFQQMLKVRREKQGNSFMERGDKGESTARKKYEERIASEIESLWNLIPPQYDEKTKQWIFHLCGLEIQCFVDAEGKPIMPVVDVIECGILVDKQHPWRRISPDGIVRINYIPRWFLEIKMPSAHEMAMYPLWKEYYYDQNQGEIHVGMQYYPTCAPFCHNWVYGGHGGNISRVEYNAHYYWTWFWPRHLRMYFEVKLPSYVRRAKALKAKLEQTKKATHDQELSSPPPPPPPPPTTITSSPSPPISEKDPDYYQIWKIASQWGRLGNTTIPQEIRDLSMTHNDASSSSSSSSYSFGSSTTIRTLDNIQHTSIDWTDWSKKEEKSLESSSVMPKTIRYRLPATSTKRKVITTPLPQQQEKEEEEEAETSVKISSSSLFNFISSSTSTTKG